ncbi:MAG: flagellar protein FlgN [Gammaproteobacteria bacterium]|nr:MAG: flagellar protein FlgN [Gammaproteobacteria bacterium]
MTAPDSTLGRLLREQHRLAGELLEVLSREEEAIAGRQAGAIEAIAGEKLALGERLEGITRDFLSEVARQGHTPDAAGIEACLGDGPLDRLWRELLDLLCRCQERNQVLGGLIAASNAFNTRLLAILQGGDPAPTYGAGGQFEKGGDSGSGASIKA